MKTFLLGLLVIAMTLSVLECDAQPSKLPKEMPEKVAINFSENSGMTNARTSIKISNQTISVEEKKINEKTSRKWSAKIEKAEQEKLYQTFVENKFDTIENDKRKSIVYDVGSEGVFIDLGNGEYYKKSYGVNQPMSGNNLKRYQAVDNAIQDLHTKYNREGLRKAVLDYTIIKYDKEAHKYIFENAKETELSIYETSQVNEFVEIAVNEQNPKQKSQSRIIELKDGYKLQFLPVLNEKGEKEVWVNALCSARENWQTQIIQVMDGGKCYFNFYINLSQKSYNRFQVNGEA